MYDTLRQHYYWPHMPQDVHCYVLQCKSCRRHRPSDKPQELLKLFLPSGPLEFIAINILGPLTRAKQGNQFLVGIMDRYNELKRAFPISRTNASEVAEVVLDDMIVPYNILDVILTDNCKQFISKLFDALCASLDTKLVTTVEYCRPVQEASRTV